MYIGKEELHFYFQTKALRMTDPFKGLICSSIRGRHVIYLRWMAFEIEAFISPYDDLETLNITQLAEFSLCGS